MRFFKGRNSSAFQKIILGAGLVFLHNAQVFSQNTGPVSAPAAPSAPTTAPAAPSTTNPVTATPTQPTQQPGQNAPATNRSRSFGNDPGSTRTVNLSDAQERSVQFEDSVRQARIANAGGRPEVLALRERIFGYRLFSTSSLANNAAANIPTPTNYVLGANDKLIIDIFGYAADHFETTVNPDGFVTLPKAGVVRVAGLGLEEAKRKIASSLSKFYAGLPASGSGGATSINITLGNIRSIRVHVTGEVIAPGTYTATSLTSVFNILLAAGGPNEIGTFRQVRVVRSNRVVVTMDLYDILIKGFSEQNILLKDQDIVQVGTFISRVAVEGQTKRTGLFELLPKQKLIDAIDYAGGFNQYAYSNRVKVYRNTSRERRIIDVMKLDFDRFEMENGDSVVVEKILERFENLVRIEGAVFRPGEFSLDNNTSLLQLIQSAEGLREDALTGRISILRTNENLGVENISVNLSDVKAGLVEDIKLRRLDRIVVPSIFDLTETAYIRVQGAINNPAAVEGGFIELPYLKNMTIEDVLVKVGGLTEAAATSRVEVVRRKRNVDPKAIDAQISDIYTFDVRPDLKVISGAPNFILYPFDEIFVRRSPNYQPQTFARVEGEVLYPDTYGIIRKDEKISDLIKRAGGLTPQAYIQGASLIRRITLSDEEVEQRRRRLQDIARTGSINSTLQSDEVSNVREEAIGIDLERIMQNPGSDYDMILRDGDMIRIPQRLQTVRIQGEVLHPTSVKFLNNKKFMDYISESGGFTKRSLRSKAYVMYANGSVDRTRRFLFLNVYPRVDPGAEIIVPERTNTVMQQLSQTQGLLGTISATFTTILGLLTVLRLSR